MAQSLKIWTLDWVAGGENGPSGFVRDLRLRWACRKAFDAQKAHFAKGAR